MLDEVERLLLVWINVAFTCLMTEQCLKKKETDNLRPVLVPKRLRPSDPEAGPSGLQTLPRRERTPESQLLFLVGFLWEFRNALYVFPLFLMGKIVLTYDQLELRPALGNELSS